MVMNALRTAAADGIGRYILFGILVMAVAGLALMDIGGFFRGDTGSNNVIRMNGKTVSITEFDKLVRGQIQPLGVSPQDAYKMGYTNRIIAGKIRQILLNDKAQESGLEISKDRAAQHIIELIKPMAQNGERPEQILNQILLNNGMNEKEFQQTIAKEMTDDLIAESVTSSLPSLNQNIVDGLYQFQNEKRTVEYLKFLDSEIKTTTPNEDTLIEQYEATKQNYKIAEQRNIEVILLDDSSITSDTDLSAADILDKKFSLVEQLEDLTASEVPTDEIKTQIPVIVTTINAIDSQGRTQSQERKLPQAISENLAQIASEAFTLEEGETSMAIELPGAQFIVIKASSITPSYFPQLSEVKDSIIANWKTEQQSKLNKEHVETVRTQLKEDKLSFKAYAKQNKRKLRTESGLMRSGTNKIFNGVSKFQIFNTTVGKTISLPIEGGIALINIKSVQQPQILEETRTTQKYAELRNNLQKTQGTDALSTILEAAHNETPALINEKLLERVYGENSDYY